MEESDFFVKPLLSCDKCDKKFQLLLKACNEQQALTSKPENKIRDFNVFVNSRLNKLSDRYAGIKLLKVFLSQCPDQVFVENCVHWMSQCLKAVVNSLTQDEAYSTLGMLLNMSHRFQELTKPVTGTIIPKLMEQLLKCRKSIASLKCLQIILHYYPGPCKVRLKSVETFLLSFLDEEDKVFVEYAARCISYLPLLQSAGNNDGNNWAVVQTELCATANTLIYELFENVREVCIPPVLTELTAGYNLTSISQDNPIEAYHLLATRVINIMAFLEGIVGGDVQHIKAVRFDILVALAYRVLAVNSKMVGHGSSMEQIALAAVLPDVHVAVFNMLQALVSCCPGGLIKFGPLFCKLVMQTLKWTSVSLEYGMERPYRKLREAAYKFLECWILRESAASCVELVADELVPMMLQDVFQKREIVTLQFQGKGQPSKQKLPQGRQKLIDPKVNEGPCESALLVLCALVQTSGSLLAPSLHMRLQEVSISLLLDIRRSSGSEDISVPFCVPGCRLQLFRLLLVLTLHPHPRWPPPTQFALFLFSWGQHDSSLEVAGFCNLAVACTRQMVHPSQSSHQFPLLVNEMRASVGLVDLEPPQGPQKNTQKRLSLSKNVEVDAEANFITPNSTRSLNNSFEIQDLEDNEVVFQSQNSSKSTKKKSRTSNSEVAMKGFAGPQTFVSSKAQKNSSNSEKPRKKKRHLEFSIEELNIGTIGKASRNGDDDWQVTDVSQIKKKVSKENKISKSVNTLEILKKRKRNLDRTPEDERNKTRKLEDTSKSNVKDLPKSCDVERSFESNEKSLKLPDEIDENSFPNSNVVKSSSKLCGKEIFESSEKDIAEIDDITKKEMEIISLVDKKQENEILKSKNSEEIITINESVVDSDIEECEQKRVHTTPVTGKNVINEKEENETSKSSPAIDRTNELKSKSNSGNDKLDSASSLSGEVILNKCNEKLKPVSPVVQLIMSSDSEPEQPKTRASGAYRRVTRSFAKLTSTPYRSSGQCLDIEEIPSLQGSGTTEMLCEISQLEDETTATATDPSVELAESDESANLVLRIDSDRESVEIQDITNETTQKSKVTENGKMESETCKDEACASGKPNTSKDMKNSMTSDREMEEVSAGMEAVADSPDVAVEGKETAVRKSNDEAGAEASDSGSTEEDILKTFVDVVSPKSE